MAEGFLEEVMLSLRLDERPVGKNLLGCGGDGEAPGGRNSICRSVEAKELSRRVAGGMRVEGAGLRTSGTPGGT